MLAEAPSGRTFTDSTSSSQALVFEGEMKTCATVRPVPLISSKFRWSAKAGVEMTRAMAAAMIILRMSRSSSPGSRGYAGDGRRQELYRIFTVHARRLGRRLDLDYLSAFAPARCRDPVYACCWACSRRWP